MVRLRKQDLVKVSTESLVAYGEIVGLPKDVVYTEADPEVHITVKVNDVIESNQPIETPAYETVTVKNVMLDN